MATAPDDSALDALLARTPEDQRARVRQLVMAAREAIAKETAARDAYAEALDARDEAVRALAAGTNAGPALLSRAVGQNQSTLRYITGPTRDRRSGRSTQPPRGSGRGT